MRVAILSDDHGNLHALDAVLDDVRAAGGADEHWVLGDIAAIGGDPVGGDPVGTTVRLREWTASDSSEGTPTAMS